MRVLAVLLLLAVPASAQEVTFPVDSLPASILVTWDDDTEASADPAAIATSYEVSLDGGAPIVVPAPPVPCVECRLVSLTVATVGQHVVSVRGRSSALGDPATLTVTVSIIVSAPQPPARLRLIGAASVSQSGSSVPPLTYLVAADGAIWTLSAPLASASTSCPGFPATQCRQLLRNGLEVGLGFELTIAADVWGRGYEGLWYRWTGTAFQPPGQATHP